MPESHHLGVAADVGHVYWLIIWRRQHGIAARHMLLACVPSDLMVVVRDLGIDRNLVVSGVESVGSNLVSTTSQGPSQRNSCNATHSLYKYTKYRRFRDLTLRGE